MTKRLSTKPSRAAAHIPIAFALAAALAWVTALSACSLFGTEADAPAPTSGDVATPEVIAHVASLVDTYVAQVESVRGMAFKRPVTSAVITRKRYREMTEAEVETAISDSLSDAVSRELAQWGYFPDTLMRYKTLFSSFAGGFAVGFYVGGSDSIFVLAENAHREDDLMHIIPHELAHALQDQYGRLERPVLADTALRTARDDARWYYNALIEGEAFFIDALATATFAYPQPDPVANAVTVVRDNRKNALARWKSTQAPNHLFLPSRSAYEFGPAFVGEAYAAKGWDSVETLYDGALQPSATTISQKAHAWVPVDLSPALSRMDTSGRYHDVGSHGSIGLLSLVNRDVTEADFFNGLNWISDAYAYVRDRRSKWGELVWVGRFTADADAQRMMDLLSPVLKGRFQGMAYPETAFYQDALAAGLPGWYLRGNGLETRLLRQGSTLYWIEGLDSARTLDLVEDLKQRESANQQKVNLTLAKRTLKAESRELEVGKGRIYRLSAFHHNAAMK